MQLYINIKYIQEYTYYVTKRTLVFIYRTLNKRIFSIVKKISYSYASLNRSRAPATEAYLKAQENTQKVFI